ncbi:MAG: amidase [Deltaproteobacteria bacterium]|nr:amidase [Deltaproteobacteria bacterium]
MSRFKEYQELDGMGLAELVRNGEVSTQEVCEEAVRCAEELNPSLNAIITPMYDLVERQIKEIPGDGPFTGVPMLLKDTHHAYKGTPMSQGCEALKGIVSDHDAEIVRRFKKAGLVVIGKTNTPEFKLGYTTEPKAFGPTLNPWDTDYSCGGSSGGSAAAVAARMVPFGSATDEGGSIRVPAAYCGLFGLKPSRGRNPVGPDFKNEWNGMSHSHVVTRSVRDSAAMLDAVAGPEPGSPYAAPLPKKPFLMEVGQPPSRFRIAYSLKQVYGKEIHPDCRKAVEETVSLLKDLGHQVEEVSPDLDETEVFINEVVIMAGHVAAKLEEIKTVFNRPVNKNTIQLQNLALGAIGRKLNVVDFIRAKESWRVAGAAMDKLLTDYDLYLTPTLGQPPIKVGSLEPSVKDRRAMNLLVSAAGGLLLGNRNRLKSIISELIDAIVAPQMPLTHIANVTGQPAMSVPVYWNNNNLPIGVHFIGRYADEASLFQLAGQLEEARPWFDRKPPLIS